VTEPFPEIHAHSETKYPDTLGIHPTTIHAEIAAIAEFL
jgi:hypothetical protein